MRCIAREKKKFHSYICDIWIKDYDKMASK